MDGRRLFLACNFIIVSEILSRIVHFLIEQFRMYRVEILIVVG